MLLSKKAKETKSTATENTTKPKLSVLKGQGLKIPLDIHARLLNVKEMIESLKTWLL